MNFTNLITAIGMATIVNTAILTLKAENKTNIYEDNTQSKPDQVCTIDYNIKTYGNNLYAKARERITARQTFNEQYIDIVIENKKTNNELLLNNQKFTINLNLNLYTYLNTNNSFYQISKIDSNTVDNSIINFIEGQNYTDYWDLYNIDFYGNGFTDLTTEESITLDQNKATITFTTNTQNDYTYIFINLAYSQVPDAEKQLLFNNGNLIQNITVENNYSLNIPDNTYEVIDIPGLMFTMLGMPFAWFSTAFDFTIFAGTPYAINIGSILLSLIVAMIAIVIIKIIMKL